MIDLDSRLAQGPLRVRSVWSEEPPERLAARILRRRRFMFALDAVAVCACLALLFIPLRRGLPAMGAPNAMVAGAPAIFADGSVAALSSNDAKLHIDEDTSNHVLAHLTGGARFEVVPNPKRAFEVQARDVRVRVLGTIFSVQELPQGHTQVLVERGRVEVAWLGGSTLLHAGEGGTFPPAVTPHDEPEAEETANARDSAPDTAPDTAPETSASPSRNANTNSPVNRRSWRDYALTGDYGKAYDELHTKGGKGHEDVRDDVGDLMLAADVARLSAHPEQAVRPLRGVCERHASDRRAPVAAFTLGRVLLDELGRPSEAAAAFQKARRLWPEGPLAEDALAREADAWERAGRIERTRTLAREYVSRYPEGRHLAAMRKTLAQ